MRHSRAPALDRHSFLNHAGRLGMTLAAGSLLTPGVPMAGFGPRSLAKGPTSEPLLQPADIRSRNGILETTITAACGPVRLGDHEFTGMLYNGNYVPPTLQARLGDTLRIMFRNDLTESIADRSSWIRRAYL